MKTAISIILLLVCGGNLFATNYHHKILSDGNDGAIVTHGVMYSTNTQAVAATDAVQYVEREGLDGGDRYTLPGKRKLLCLI